MKHNNKTKFHDDFIISYRIDTASLATGLSVSYIKENIKSGALKSNLITPKVRVILKENLLDFIKNQNTINTERNEDEN